MKRLQRWGIAYEVVQNACNMYNYNHLKEREFFQVDEYNKLGKFTCPGHPSKLYNTLAKLYRNSPCLDEHTEYICRNILGMLDDEFEQRIIEKVFE
jgi:benzylsuccinate CoA-transferase BbsF subunit